MDKPGTMKPFIPILTAIFISATAHAQVEIKASEAAQHAGDSVVFTSNIMSGKYLHSSPGSPTLLNVGALYPNQLVTLVVLGADRYNFSEPPEYAYVKKQVKVWGRVEVVKGKPQIVLHNEKQIAVLSDLEEVRPAKGQ
jgi:hypothetical protein